MEMRERRGEGAQQRGRGLCALPLSARCVARRAGEGTGDKREDPASGPDCTVQDALPDNHWGRGEGRDSGWVIVGKSLNLLESLCPYLL